MSFERIPEFYAQRNILITGASGFMGKVLVEKLLRSCPELGKLYLIVRSKKNKSAAERWRETTESMVFDRLKSERPGILEDKVEVMEGDIKEKGLGLSERDFKFLQENITVIFHVAASVRFNDSLPDAVFMNTRGTHELIKLALGIKNIKAFAHVSTTFCNCYQTETDERMYPPPADWKETIDICEKLDKREVSILSPKYLGVFPNTYTFTKNLAECLIQEYSDRLPFVILRPSIVIASVKEPIPGWIDNVNGPIGLILAAGKGVIRISFINKEAIPDYMAADIAIKGIIVSAWKRAQNPESTELPIYNMASTSKGISNGAMMELGYSVNRRYPVSGMLWIPSSWTTSNMTWYQINAVLFHFIPAVVIDTILKLIGKKPMLLDVQKRIHIATMALGYFTTKHWVFGNTRFLALNNEVPIEDKEDFDYDFQDVDAYEYFRTAVKMGKKTLLNEDEDEVLPRTRVAIRRLEWLDKLTTYSVRGFLVWLAYRYFMV